MAEYTVHNGTYTFPTDGCQLVLTRVHRDRRGRIFVDADLITLDGQAYLAHDSGDIGAGRFREPFARQAASRNASNPQPYEALLFKAYLALRNDPSISDTTPVARFTSLPEFLNHVAPQGDAVVAGLIERGALYGLAAKPKTGKTLLLLQTADRISFLWGCTSTGGAADFLNGQEREVVSWVAPSTPRPGRGACVSGVVPEARPGPSSDWMADRCQLRFSLGTRLQRLRGGGKSLFSYKVC